MNAVYIPFILFAFLGDGNAFIIPRNTTESGTEANNPNSLLYRCTSLILYQLYSSFVVEILSLFACWLMTDLKVFTDKVWLILVIPMLLINAVGLGIDVLSTDQSARQAMLPWIAVGNYVIVTELLWNMVVSSYPFYSLLKRTESIDSTTDTVHVQRTSSFALVRVASKIFLLLTVSCPGILTVRFMLENLGVKSGWLLVMAKYQITPSILLVFLTSSFAECLHLRKHRCCHPKDTTWSVYSNRQKFHTLSGFLLSLLATAQFLALYFEIWFLLRAFLVQQLAATAFFMLLYFDKEMEFVVPSLQDQRCSRVHPKFI